MGKKSEYKCGVVSVSFRPQSPEEIIVAAKDAGLSCIEWGSDIHAPYNDEEKIEKIVELQEKYGISCSSYGTYFRLGRDNTEELEKYAEAAKKLGTNIMRVWCGDKAAYQYTDEEKRVLLDECKKAAEIAKRCDVVLCMECHHWTYTETAEGMTELMEAVNSENFRMYWQPSQFLSVEKNVCYAKSVSKYCKAIHVFNWEGETKFPLSEAEDAWCKYLSCFGSDITLLFEFMPDDKIESLPAECEALFRITERMN